MSAQTTIAKLRKSVDDARAKGMTDAEVIRILADVAKSSPEAYDNLVMTYRATVKANRSDLSSAFEALLFDTPGGQAVTLDEEAALKRIGSSALAKAKVADADVRKTAETGRVNWGGLGGKPTS